MYEIFVFSMYGALYSIALAVASAVFYFCFMVSLYIIKHNTRLNRTYDDGNPELFKDFYIATPEMRIEMAYIMEDFAVEANKKRANLFAYDASSSYNKNRLLPYGKKTPEKLQPAG